MSQREKVQIGSSPRDKIIERAIAVLEKDGEAGIRTNTIAADCGCTAPILYREFQSREGLIIAAQAERYKRSSQEAVVGLIRQITIATSREELYDNVSTSLDSIFSITRSQYRRLRADVMGSAVSRAELRQEILRIDIEYSGLIAAAYRPAVEAGWMSPIVNLEVIALWAQGLVNSRVAIEFDSQSAYATAWDELTKRVILRELFG
ncbi:hypothetical protein LBMAG13_03910 [Actinomycetes bacterium]|nr:hypothetical protein LBMAG13_03910 [Actinomycetes bacterium]